MKHCGLLSIIPSGPLASVLWLSVSSSTASSRCSMLASDGSRGQLVSSTDTSGLLDGGVSGDRSNGNPGSEDGIAQEPGVLILPPEVERELSRADASLGTLGRPLDRRNPFFVGLTGALGVGVVYLLFRGLSDVTSVLVIVGVALFIAIG